jgi:archaeal flagellin FlaB
MNQKSTDCTAFTGLEAAIVLIAFVTVASVFSYVILGAGFSTTEKSQAVIHSSIGQASSVMMNTGDVYGISSTGNSLDMVNFTLKLSSGGGSIDFGTVAITYSDSTHLETLKPVPGLISTSTTPGSWAIIERQNEVGNPNNLLEKGEFFVVSIHPSQGIVPYERFNIELKPSGGAAMTIQRTAPPNITPVNQLY